MRIFLRSILLFSTLILNIFATAQVTWNQTGNNYTTGKLAIGITLPDYPLHVEYLGATGLTALISTNGADFRFSGHAMSLAAKPSFSYVPYLEWRNNTSVRQAYFGWRSDVFNLTLENGFNFSINGGSVGIGTATPTARLHIQGGGFRHGAPGEINIDAPGVIGGRFKILDNGRVGIGTTAPQSSLEINQPDASVRITASNGTAAGVGNPSLYINRNASEGLKLEYVPNVLARISNTYVGPLGHLAFATSGQDRLFITGNGNVGIGTTNPGSYKLAVEGKIGAKEIVVTTAGWADDVFENTYSLRPLSEVESYIKENKHLPEIPSAKEVEVNGVNLGEMNVLLLKKVEELTLYLIELKKENIDQRKQNERLQSKIESILQKLNACE